MSIPSMYPSFAQGTEFNQSAYFSGAGTVIVGQLMNLVVSLGVAKRNIYLGMLPYFGDVNTTNILPFQYNMTVQLRRKGKVQLDIPYCTDPLAFADVGGNFSAGIYCNRFEAGDKTIRVMKQMTINGVTGLQALLVSPFTITCDCDEIALIVNRNSTNALGELFIYFACLNEIVT
jgi:hypothetical protein